MSGQEVHIVAILHPAPGKLDRFNELLKGMCKDVHEKEDYTLRYLATQQLGESSPDIIIFETYKNKAAADQHTTEPHFKELFAIFEKEGILDKKPYIAQSTSTIGFDLDRKLL